MPGRRLARAALAGMLALRRSEARGAGLMFGAMFEVIGFITGWGPAGTEGGDAEVEAAMILGAAGFATGLVGGIAIGSTLRHWETVYRSGD